MAGGLLEDGRSVVGGWAGLPSLSRGGLAAPQPRPSSLAWISASTFFAVFFFFILALISRLFPSEATYWQLSRSRWRSGFGWMGSSEGVRAMGSCLFFEEASFEGAACDMKPC